MHALSAALYALAFCLCLKVPIVAGNDFPSLLVANATVGKDILLYIFQDFKYVKLIYKFILSYHP